MHIKAFYIVYVALVFTGCRKPDSQINSFSSSSKTQTVSPAVCLLPPGKHGVQSVVFQSGAYDLFIYNAPICVKQPVRIEKLMLAELESTQGASAEIEIANSKDPILHLTRDFKIEMVSVVQDPNSGHQVREEKSSWMPFLAGAAGAAVAGMAVNALFRQPKYYMPPPARPGMADVRGYGASSTTYQGAMSDYQNRWKQPPPQPSQNKGSFFRRKENTAAVQQRALPPPQQAPQQQRMENRERPFFQRKMPPKNRSFFRRRSR